jgi:hypothetical protein
MFERDQYGAVDFAVRATGDFPTGTGLAHLNTEGEGVVAAP